jgi:hypothetical protein
MLRKHSMTMLVGWANREPRGCGVKVQVVVL